ncbi:hypothetical protein PM082_022038 [Marasmius tenuissimus]|nr:hypothetical protein PM082_022038 [Marasmius tenuissimus]
MQKDSNRRIFELGGSIRAAYDLAGLTFNILLTILTAGRIWHVSRAACETMGQDVRRWYATIITIILESGLLYPMIQLVRTILNYTYNIYVYGPIPIDLGMITMQAAVSSRSLRLPLTPELMNKQGIAPTLIIARAISHKGLRTLNGGSTSVSTGGMQFASRSRVINTSTAGASDSEMHDLERFDGKVLGAEKEEQAS